MSILSDTAEFLAEGGIDVKELRDRSVGADGIVYVTHDEFDDQDPTETRGLALLLVVSHTGPLEELIDKVWLRLYESSGRYTPYFYRVEYMAHPFIGTMQGKRPNFDFARMLVSTNVRINAG